MIVTDFPDRFARTKTETDVTFEALCERIINAPTVAYKEQCAWIKLGAFGDDVENVESGCLRTNRNLRRVSGVELDYDLEEMSIDEAADLFRARGVRAFLYTSPSHMADKPRWRALLPFSHERDPVERDTYAARGNGVLGGVVSDESHTRSQGYYAGRVAGVLFESRMIDGACIDEVGGLPEIGRRGPGATGHTGYTREHAYDDVREGINLHAAINHLAMLGEAKADIEAAMLESRARTDDSTRWAKRFAEIDRSSRGAERRKEREQQRTLASIGVPPLPPVVGLPLIKPGEFAARKLQKRKWVCEPLIPLGETTLMYGPGAAGKSLLLLILALCMACGFRWLGMPVPILRTLFFTCEDDADELNRRAAKVLQSLGVTWAECGDRFAAVPMRGTEASAVLAVASKDGTLTPTPTYAALRKLVEDFKPDVVIIDTLADVFAGNENDRSHAKQFVKLIERLYPATFIVTAHPSVSGQADGRGASGSTGWPAAVRSHLYLERVRGDEGAEPDPDLRQLSNLKANYAQAGSGGIELRWIDGVFVRSDRQAREEGGGGDADELFLELLARYTAQGRYVNASSGTTFAPSVFAKDDAAKAARLTKRALAAAMNRLFEAGRIVVQTRKVSGHQRSFIALADRS